MSKFTARSYDMVALAAQDNTIATSANGAAGAAVTVTLAHDSANIVYLTGIQITSTAPAAVESGLVQITGLSQAGGGSGTLEYEFVESATSGGELLIEFGTPIPAKDVNTDIVVSVPAIASGGAVAVSVQGYKRPE